MEADPFHLCGRHHWCRSHDRRRHVDGSHLSFPGPYHLGFENDRDHDRGRDDHNRDHDDHLCVANSPDENDEEGKEIVRAEENVHGHDGSRKLVLDHGRSRSARTQKEGYVPTIDIR